MYPYILSSGAYLPEKRISNDDLAKTVDTSDEWIYSHTGIRYRHIVEDEKCSDLALKASQQALERANLKPEDLDLILVATSTPDYLSFPSAATVLQSKIGAVNAGALDITAACTGFVYAIEIASNFIKTGAAKHILIVGADILSQLVDWEDRNTCILFGDGAGAAIIGASESENSVIIDSILKAEGDEGKYLSTGPSDVNKYIKDGKFDISSMYMKMDGRRVYNFAVRVLSKTIKDLLERNNYCVDDIAYIIPHQANIRIIEAASKRTGIPIEKFYVNIEEVANTSAATIPIALNEMMEKNLLKRGDLVLTVGFGGGLTYGGNLLKF